MRILLIDGNHLAGRCRAVMNDLVRSDGKRSGVVHGVVKGLSFVRNKLRIDFPQMVICWDHGRSIIRNLIYPHYKAGREVAEDDEEAQKEKLEYYHQLNALHGICESLGIRQVRVKGVEADDLLSIFNRFYLDHGNLTIVYSGDNDLHQLVNGRTEIFDPKREIMDEAAVLEKHGFNNIKEFLLYKCIAGDSSDNIDGIKGIGYARAKLIFKWLGVDFELWAKPKVKDGEIPAKEKRWVDLAIANWDKIQRNWLLMKLPETWDESHYSLAQEECALEQLLQSSMCANRGTFINQLTEWELSDTLENIQRF